MPTYAIRHFVSTAGIDLFSDWLTRVRDPIAKERTMKDRSHDEAMAELFRDDPEFAAHYLDEILRDGEQADLLMALRQMAKAFGGAGNVAAKAGINQTQIYRTLSADGNPALSTLFAILKAMNLRLSVQPLRV